MQVNSTRLIHCRVRYVLCVSMPVLSDCGGIVLVVVGCYECHIWRRLRILGICWRCEYIRTRKAEIGVSVLPMYISTASANLNERRLNN